MKKALKVKGKHDNTIHSNSKLRIKIALHLYSNLNYKLAQV